MQLNKKCLYKNKFIDTNIVYKIKALSDTIVYYGAYSENDKDFDVMLFANYKFKESFINDFNQVKNG